MKIKSLVSAVLNESIERRQPIGLIANMPNGKPSLFVVGRLDYVSVFPSALKEKSYLAEVHLLDGVNYFPEKDYRPYFPHDESCKLRDNSLIYDKRQQFEEKMQSLMKKVETKDNFPLFVRCLSDMKGWK